MKQFILRLLYKWGWCSTLPNPTRKQVQKVIDTFETYRDKYPTIDIDMSIGAVNCGTPVCHAGAYLIGDCIVNRYSTDQLNDNCTYHDGANLMANDLGFKSRYDLSRWAHHNEKIWGNINGSVMFSNIVAFTETYERGRDEIISIDTIIDHWKVVQSRLKS